MPAVHALTDVTGFGLAGHLLEICRGSKLAARSAISTRCPSSPRRSTGRSRASRPARRTATGRATAHEVSCPRARPSGSGSSFRSADQRRAAGRLRAGGGAGGAGGVREAGLRPGAHDRPACRRRAAPDGYLSSGRKPFQTLSSISGCAASVGWMRSGWKTCGLLGEVLEQERHQRGAAAASRARRRPLELAACSPGRSWAACCMPTSSTRAPAFCACCDDGAEVLLHLRHRQAAQAVVARRARGSRPPACAARATCAMRASPPPVVSPEMLALTTL